MGKYFKDFFDAIINIFIFLPHYFSVTSILKTFFAPWKNLISKKTATGFSFNEWLSRASFNAISRIIGFFARLILLLIFLSIECLFILSIPFLVIAFVVLSPLFYIYDLLNKTPEEEKPRLKEEFVKTHDLNPENLKAVEDWFELYYEQSLRKTSWWNLQKLLTVPPLARDWALGYTPTLDKYCDELTSTSYQEQVKHVVGRKTEFKQIEQILSKTEGANVLLIGEEGVGKQTIIDSFSRRVHDGKTNSILNYKRILKINLESILTENTDQKKREYFLEELLKEAIEAKNVILIIENLEKYISGDEYVDLSAPIEKSASNPNIHIIATVTPFNNDKFVLKKDRLNQLFSKIEVGEVSAQDTLTILLELTSIFEKKYQMTIPYETVKSIVEKSEFYITSIPFPEKAIEVFDTACSQAFQTRKNKLLPEDVDSTLEQMTHAPVKITDSAKKTLIDFESVLSQKIIGQDEAVKQLSAALRRSFVLLGKRKKPLASFLFLGPTGVGKTETAKALADIFFHEDKHLIRFDMSLYQNKEDIENLIGSMQTNNPGLLTQAVRDKPFAVLLLDEIEKANKDLLNIFLTILDEGYFTDGRGKNVDCKNLVIIATSNAGSDFIYQKINSSKDLQQELIDYLIEKGLFSPEFLNRFDGVISFNTLTGDSVSKIARKMIDKLSQDYQKSYKVSLSVSDQTINSIVTKGYNSQFGARDLERSLLNQVQDVINKRLLEGSLKGGEVINL